MGRISAIIFLLSLSVLTCVSCGGDSNSTGAEPQKPIDGAMKARIQTTGTDFIYNDTGDYKLFVDGTDSTTTDDLADTVAVKGLSAGSHQVKLSGEAFNCDIQGDNPRGIHITGGDTTAVDLTVKCKPVSNNQIAFISTRDGGDKDIFLMDNDGTNLQQLTANGVLDTDPAIANNGQKIAFVSDRGGHKNIYTMDVDGSNVRQITHTDSASINPAWSPDNSKLAYADKKEGNFEIYTVKLDGSDLQRLTDDAAKDTYPSWSPDGDQIAFETNRIVGQYDIYIMDADGKNKRQLTAGGNDYDYEPSWSPGGDWISFSKLIQNSTGADRDIEIWKIKKTGSGAQQLTYNQNLAADEYSSWSFSSNNLVYATNQPGNGEIYKMDKDGNNMTNLTQSPAYDAKPDWGPFFTVNSGQPFQY